MVRKRQRHLDHQVASTVAIQQRYNRTVAVMVAILVLAISWYLVKIFAANGNPFSCPDTAQVHPLLKDGNAGNSYGNDQYRGDDCVHHLQWYLKALTYDLGTSGPNGDGIDGVYGSKTSSSLRDFQYRKGLAVDGDVGQNTWTALHNSTSPPAGRNASCGGMSGVPGQINTGQSFNVTVRMNNNGSVTWYASGSTPYRLGSANPRNNNNWQVQRVGLGGDVPPGGQGVFSFTAKAPGSAGTYAFGWQMVQEFVTWFGPDPTCTQNVAVVAQPAPLPPKPDVTLTANGQSGSITLTTGSSLILEWRATNNPTTCTAGGSWSGTKAASGSDNRTSDTATAGTRSYSLECSNAGGKGSASVAVTVNSPPAGGGGGTPGGGGGTPGGGSGGGGGTPGGGNPITNLFKKPAAPPAPAGPDTQAPATPEGFVATLGPDQSVVQLAWQEAKDDRGIRNYVLERSLDDKTWNTLSDSITATSYTDKDTAYTTQYYYRVKAFDGAGNGSGYARAQIKTGSFSANASAGNETSLTSEDSLVTVVLPAGTISGDANCSVVLDMSNQNLINATKLVLVAGPYSLVCKDSSGADITVYNSPGSVQMLLTKDQIQKFVKQQAYQFDTAASRWVQIKDAKFDKKKGAFSFAVAGSTQFAVLGKVKPGPPWGLFSFLFLLLLGGGGFFIVRLRQAQRSHYDEYIRRKYYNL
jgi:peptidoglycan hydrolase-like protein with peptidoglycan-binding domain